LRDKAADNGSYLSCVFKTQTHLDFISLHIRRVAKPVQQLHVAQQHPRPPPPPPPTSLPPTRSPTRFTESSMTYRSEKDKMLAGEPFNPFDKTLMHERHLSTQAQSIFNSSKANPSNVLSSTTVDHFFKQILNASRHREGKQIEIHMGPNCHVATPFACDYGYHLSMGENVVIGADCHLHDSARISIGRNCKIGVRVTIQTLKTPTDNKSLKGSNGTEIAQEVHIGENVYIGDNCVIEAGVHIGPNTIVRPGSVVSRVSSQPCNDLNIRILTLYSLCLPTASLMEILRSSYLTEILSTTTTLCSRNLSEQFVMYEICARYLTYLIWVLHVTLRTTVWCRS
jgi:acetyltransferase-like isoleucine patch superfamily enzyme